MKAMPGAPSRSAIAQMEQYSRNFERATRQRYGFGLRHDVNRINERIRLTERALNRYNGLQSVISKSIPPIRLVDRVANNFASQLPNVHRILPGITALESRADALNVALAKNQVLVRGATEARRSLVVLDAALAKNREFSSLYHEFPVPSLIRLEERNSISPYILNQYRANQFGTNPCATDLIEDEVDVVKLLNYYGFELTLYHYQESVLAFRKDLFAASNSQIRTSFESFVIELCYSVTKTHKDGARSAIDYLEHMSFLSRERASILRNFWAINHTNGPHPGYAHRTQTKGRLSMITGIVFDLISLLGRSPKLVQS